MKVQSAKTAKSSGKLNSWKDRAKDTSEASGNCLALWRPAWETGPALWGFGAAAFAGAVFASGTLALEPALVMAGTGFAMALKRSRDAFAVWKDRLPLSGKAPCFMSFDDLALQMRRMGTGELPQSARKGLTAAEALRSTVRARGVKFLPEAEPAVTQLWAGQGFVWTPAEAQRLYELSRADWRSMLVPLPIRRFLSDEPGLGDASPGIPVIHGVNGSEEAIVRPLSSLGGGTLLVGTTQAGKGVVLTSLVSQAILRGEAVIVIDPKSSKRLRHAVIAACRAAGRPEPMEFHPAFPKRGVKLNPLGTFTRSTEIASRICAVLPEGDGAFTAFAWRAIYVMTEGLLFLGRQPSLRVFRSLLERGIEPLLEEALRQDLAAKTPLWEERLEIILDQEARSLKIPVGSSADLELAALVLLWERTAGSQAGEPAVEGLISVYRHSREHYAKITASLLPVLSMLTAGPLGESLSPDTPEASAMKALSGESSDERPAVRNCEKITFNF